MERIKKMLLAKFSIHVVYSKKSLNKANINPEIKRMYIQR